MYLLDANIFIRAKNEYYGTDFVPGFWTWLAEEYRAVDVRSVSAVRNELLAQEDALSEWARRLPNDFWIEEGDADVTSLRAVAAWAMTVSAAYSQQARTDFLAKADYRLVAMAHAGGHVIVTHETPAPDAKRVIKIPDAGQTFQVKCREPFTLFSELGLILVRPTVSS